MKERQWKGYNVEDVREMLRAEISERGDQLALAKRIGISGSWLSDILLGHRAPANRVLQYLKLERRAVRIYVKRAVAPPGGAGSREHD